LVEAAVKGVELLELAARQLLRVLHRPRGVVDPALLGIT
jgi:hypothetical protein